MIVASPWASSQSPLVFVSCSSPPAAVSPVPPVVFSRLPRPAGASPFHAPAQVKRCESRPSLDTRASAFTLQAFPQRGTVPDARGASASQPGLLEVNVPSPRSLPHWTYWHCWITWWLIHSASQRSELDVLMCKWVKSASVCYTLTFCVLTWRCCLGSRPRSWSPGCLSSPHWWCLRFGCCPGRRRNPRTRWARRPSCCKNHSSFVALHSTHGCCLLTDENISD